MKKLFLTMSILAIANIAQAYVDTSLPSSGVNLSQPYTGYYVTPPVQLAPNDDYIERSQRHIDRVIENSNRNNYYHSMHYNTQRTYYPTNYNVPETNTEPYRFGGPM